MNETGDTYTFLPWLRRGIAGRITAADGDVAVKTRASVRVDVKLTGEPMAAGSAPDETVGRDVAFYGPGDIVGVDQRAIVRTEPKHWITNFEPNYLAHVEFYDEDFPWRYTPAAPSGDSLKLRPWLTLAVLAEGEFKEPAMGRRPLPCISVSDPDLLPPAADLWAWAHVHVNNDLASTPTEFVTNDLTGLSARADAFLGASPDRAASRLVCPRKLEENTPYHAFLIPTFETGRLAGLGLSPATAPFATQSAWEAYPANPETQPETGLLPVYHRWYFHTGTRGDFEYLVELLQPRPVDKRVGTRPIDVQRPGANLPGIDGPVGGYLRLGGALKVPQSRYTDDEWKEIEKYENWDKPGPHPFQVAMAAFVNLPDEYQRRAAAAANATADSKGADTSFLDDEAPADPLITAPIYGRWHSLMPRLYDDAGGAPLTTRGNWVHQLNLDPRHRVAAGSGTRVVQKYQEDYMSAAWEQIGDVLEANRRIRWSKFGTLVSRVWHGGAVIPRMKMPGRLLTFASPSATRILSNGQTVRHRQELSPVPPGLTAPVFRRMIRPGGRLVKTLGFTPAQPATSVVDAVNSGAVTTAPPKTAPAGAPSTDSVAAAVRPKGLPGWVIELLRRLRDIKLRLLVFAIVLLVALVLLLWLLPLPAALLAFLVLLVIAAILWWLVGKWSLAVVAGDTFSDDTADPAIIDQLPGSPDFTVVDPDNPPPLSGQTGPDSEEAVLFKRAWRDWLVLISASSAAAKRPAPVPLDLPGLERDIASSLDPAKAIPARLHASLTIPPRIGTQMEDPAGEVMYYPIIDKPMYAPLEELSSELFLPNIGLIANDSITLLETNQPFIESYMVGLNHEFARELLWREYPTDQRGSTFRQFWDVDSAIPPSKSGDAVFRETLRDIPKLHRWPLMSKLGDHDAREKPGDNEDELVLVIRGELLKKYPTAIIYANKADWTRKNGKIDPTAERILKQPPADQHGDPPRDIKQFPLYEAKVTPDVYFFGFDLTEEEAKGGSGANETDDAGWFFVIQERPGEPRFGLDISRESAAIENVNDLAWPDAALKGKFLSAASFTSLTLSKPGGASSEKLDQYNEDKLVAPAQSSSARWAYLLYQAPVMVAVHASEMLKDG